MSNLPDRAGARRPVFVSRAEEFKTRLQQDMARRAALPKDHPDYASPDIEIDNNNIRRDADGKEINIRGKKPKNKGK